MTITLSGLASGLDVQSMVDGLMSAARVPVNQLVQQKSRVDAAAQTISSISTKLATFKSAALALSTPSGFSSFTASSSDGSVVASASGATSAGSYDVVVSSLAEVQKSSSNTNYASGTSTIGKTGKLTFTVGSNAPVVVNFASTDTIADLAAKISSSGARLTASVVTTPTGTKLAVQGLDTGAANAFTVSETGGANIRLTSYQSASDAAFTVDGLAMTSPTNQATTAVPGVKLVFTKTTTTPTTISVAADATALKQKITAFVNAYNDFVSTSHNAAGWGTIKPSNSALQADSAIRSSLRRMSAVGRQAIPGATGKYTTLASIGITTKNDGTFAFDTAKLDAAVSADPTGVSRLFVTDATTGSTGAMKAFMSAVDLLTTGSSSTLGARLDSLSNQSRRMSDQADRMEDQLTKYQTMLQKQFSAMDSAVAQYQKMANALPTSNT